MKSGPVKGSPQSPKIVLHNVGQKLRRMRTELLQMVALVEETLARVEGETA